jgi:DNA-binding CsgD family transcriptional regulator
LIQEATMAVGIRVSLEVNGRQVAVFRTAGGFEMDFAGDGAVYVPVQDLAEALRFLDGVRAGLEECERAYVALTRRAAGDTFAGIMQLQPGGGSKMLTTAEFAAQLAEVPVNGNGKVQGDSPGEIPGATDGASGGACERASGGASGGAKKRRPATPEQRELVARLSLEGKHTVQEIAEAAGLSPSTVYAIRAAVSRAVDAEVQKEAEQTPVGEGFRTNGLGRLADQTDGNR